MSLLYRAASRSPYTAVRTSGLTSTRSLSGTACRLSSPPHSEGPPSAKAAGKSNHPADDGQSSASTNDSTEDLSADDHPAKQPDTQIDGDRSTGFNKKSGDIQGGKEGLKHRTDKQ